jgi:hypothetical protein
VSAESTGADHRRLARRATLLLAGLAVPTALVAWLVAGVPGVLGALIGLGFVALLFGAASASLAWAVDHAPDAAVAVLAGGAFVRLALYAAVLSGLARVDWVHPPSLAIATAVGATITLVAELRWLARTPRLFHVDASAARPIGTDAHPTPHATGADAPDAAHHTGSRSL